VGEPEPEPDADRPTIAPFLGALAIVVIVLIAIVLLNYFGDEDKPAGQQIAESVMGQNDALQRQHYADFRGYTCRSQLGNEAEILAGQRDSVAKHGERYIDDITDVAVDGDHATAKVTYHFGNAPDAKTAVETALVREDEAWKVCSTGPR